MTWCVLSRSIGHATHFPSGRVCSRPVWERGLGRASWANSQAVSPPNPCLGSHRGVLPVAVLAVRSHFVSSLLFFSCPLFIMVVHLRCFRLRDRRRASKTRGVEAPLPGSPRRAPRLRLLMHAFLVSEGFETAQNHRSAFFCHSTKRSRQAASTLHAWRRTSDEPVFRPEHHSSLLNQLVSLLCR